MELKETTVTELHAHLNRILGREITTQDADIAVAVLNDQKMPVGGIIAEFMGAEVHIKQLVLSEGLQAVGVDAALLREVFMRSGQRGAKVATAYADNEAVQVFYEANGFTVFGELADVPVMGRTRVYLQRRL
ncbi:hypothetical protein QFK56_01835 [Weissella cibaria]|uniref:hypothetical protein n=1 Tax=Weissella cibaria TaxID=137591 RepID=UPI002455C4DA|nr:hypothetical protein [Weissella cibaria]MDH5011900.1 hypothetical protein [Weissella cibaria]